MELTPAAQMRQLNRSRTAITSAPAESSRQQSTRSLRADRLSISRQTTSFIQEQDRIAQEIAKIIQRFTADNKTEDQGKTEDEMLAEDLKVKQRCQKIAARLMAGDKVPPKDMQYLAENDMQTYRLAMAARMMAPKKKPKEWESVLEDDEKEAGASGGSGASSGAAESGGGTEASGGAAEAAAE